MLSVSGLLISCSLCDASLGIILVSFEFLVDRNEPDLDKGPVQEAHVVVRLPPVCKTSAHVEC